MKKALIVGVLMLGSFVGGTYAAAPHHVTRTPSVQLKNEGFADSKQDDCEQGFKPACDWLTGN
ncbi:hypothetical protein [Streptomyces sp. NPDC048489]|uniref:hypothetical protein n=1 Tax=Streptomyces sp. NPDC048489 TaxID=3154504 RepID=UPI00341D80DD